MYVYGWFCNNNNNVDMSNTDFFYLFLSQKLLNANIETSY